MKRILISLGEQRKDEYVDAIRLAGGEGYMAYLPDFINDYDKPLSESVIDIAHKYDGLILGGGGDLHPKWFGEEINGSKRINNLRDTCEIALAKEFINLGKPIMGICRGHQVMNVLLGGTLHQDNGEEINKIHASTGTTYKTHSTYCTYNENSRGNYLIDLYGQQFKVNSYHHQSIDILADGLIPLQYSDDGVVEGVIHESYPYIGVQWHPERLCKQNNKDGTEGICVDSTPLFKYFLNELN